MLQTEGSISPIMLWDERVGVANDQPQRVVLGAPGRRAQSPTHTSANAETLPQTLPLTHTHHSTTRPCGSWRCRAFTLQLSGEGGGSFGRVEDVRELNRKSVITPKT